MRAGKRILFVEDEPDTLALMTLALRAARFVVEAVGTVAEAQALLDTARYDVVIADWRLPDGEGLAVADRAAGLGSITIIYSSYLFQIPAGTALGHELLMKPMRPGEFVAAVEHCIGVHNR